MALLLKHFIPRTESPSEKCSKCQGNIEHHPDDIRNIKCLDGKQVCDDCFFGARGDEIEEDLRRAAAANSSDKGNKAMH